MSIDLRTHITKKKTEAYTGKLKFKEKLAGENKTWMDSSNVKTWKTTETIYSYHLMEMYKSIVCFELVTGIS